MVYEYLMRTFNKKRAAFLVLLDPDYTKNIENRVKVLCESGADAILIGGSILSNADFDNFVRIVKKKVIYL